MPWERVKTARLMERRSPVATTAAGGMDAAAGPVQLVERWASAFLAGAGRRGVGPFREL